jgi:nucleotide-binding universal stress UspA family protein
MKNILLPTDFSDNSWNAIQYAVELFKDKKCNFFLLNTYTPMIYNVEFMEVNTAKVGLINAMRETSEHKIDEVQEKIENQFKNPKHIFSKISSFETLTSEIEALYEGDVIHFIVMGTKGATGLTKVLFGSNTVHVIKNAKCPVLAVPSGFTFESPNEILFPSDYEVSFHKKIVEEIIGIANSHHSRVNILNASDGHNLSKKQENNKQKLEGLFKNVAHIFHNDRNNNIIESINNFQLKVPVNLLVMINNKHSFFENLFFKSTINQIGFHLNIPFLVIPSKL